MPEIKVRRLSKRDFLKKFGPSRFDTDYRYSRYDFHQRGVEQALNSLKELIEARRMEYTPANAEMLFDNIWHAYKEQQPEWLDSVDQRLFRDLIQQFGVHQVRPEPLDEALHDMFNCNMREGLPSRLFDVVRPDDLKSQLGTWQKIEILLPPTQRDVFRVTEKASTADPLGVLSTSGFYLSLEPTRGTFTAHRGSRVTIEDVTISFRGSYVRPAYGIYLHPSQSENIEYTLNSDTDRLFTVRTECNPTSKVYDTVWIEPQD